MESKQFNIFALVLLFPLLYMYFRADSALKRKLVCNVLGMKDIHGPAEYFPKWIGSCFKFWPYSKSFQVGLKVVAEFPGMMKITGANKTFVVLNSVSIVEQFLKSTDFGHAEKAPVMYGLMKPFITNGVLVSNGKFWQGQRKVLLKSQHFQSLKGYMEMLNEHSGNFVKELKLLFEDGKDHEINHHINILFLNIINKMITGYDLDSSKEFDDYHHNFKIWKDSIVKRFLNPWLLLPPLWNFHPMSRAQEKSVKNLFDFARQRVQEHKKKRNEEICLKHVTNMASDRCVLDDLLDADMHVDQIVDEVNTMIFGGHETGATVIHFFCLCMATHVGSQEACQQEIDQFFENPENSKKGQLTYEAVNSNLKYLERCILETLRLFPPVFLFIRELKTPFAVTRENKTYLLPPEVNVVVTPFGLHRNPEYFPNPEIFDPDRFLPDEVVKKPAFSFLPFSGGRRNCLGQKFAMVELKVIACYLLRNFMISSKDKMEDVCLLPFVTLTPENDFRFQFSKRTARIGSVND